MEENKAVQWSLMGATLFGASILILCFVFIFIEPQIRFDPEAPQICAEKSPEVACYNVTLDIFNMVYNNFYENCRNEIKSKLGPNKVTSLIGPAVRKCTLRHFDKSVHASRKNLSGEGSRCKDYFVELDSPGN